MEEAALPTNLDLVDPTPDIHQLFRKYNTQYFEGKLSSVKLRWDTTMKLCVIFVLCWPEDENDSKNLLVV